MTRKEWEDVLFAAVPDEVVQDKLNYYVLALESDVAKLRELVRILYYCGLPWKDCDKCAMNGADMHVEISEIEYCDGMYDRLHELGVEVDE